MSRMKASSNCKVFRRLVDIFNWLPKELSLPSKMERSKLWSRWANSTPKLSACFLVVSSLIPRLQLYERATYRYHWIRNAVHISDLLLKIWRKCYYTANSLPSSVSPESSTIKWMDLPRTQVHHSTGKLSIKWSYLFQNTLEGLPICYQYAEMKFYVDRQPAVFGEFGRFYSSSRLLQLHVLSLGNEFFEKTNGSYVHNANHTEQVNLLFSSFFC